MRIVSWNLHGANVPGRASDEQQHRSWAHMRDLGADLILAQEVSAAGVPEWVTDEWTLLSGEYGRFRKNSNWGSVVAARPALRLRPHPESPADPWLAHLYDHVLVGQIDLPESGTALVASVHTPAQPVRDWLREHPMALPLADDELAALQRPACEELPYINDFAFTALDRVVKSGRFVVAGDWNTCRKYPGGPEFFARAQARGWVECHREPEERSFFGSKPDGGYQLDHAFCDRATARSISSCRVTVSDIVRELSDHAPVVTDLVRVEGEPPSVA
jgi:endonuclease/exonuclease/phosphatase family metal-dependent hydrolase